MNIKFTYIPCKSAYEESDFTGVYIELDDFSGLYPSIPFKTNDLSSIYLQREHEPLETEAYKLGGTEK